MDYVRVIQVSLESLGAHKLRTMLTMLGVVIGVSAVISMLSIGKGAEREVLQQIEILGVNNIIVKAKVPEISDASETGHGKSAGLSFGDADNIAMFSNLVENIVPQRFEAIPTITHGSQKAPVRVVSTTPDFIYSSSIEVETGRFINASDNESCAQVCVLGAKAKRALFAFEDPIGKTVRIDDLDFTVVGIMADKYIGRGKVEGLEMKNFNEDVYIPFNTARQKIPKVDPEGSGGSVMIMNGSIYRESGTSNVPDVDQLTISVTDLDFVPATAKLVERILKRRHGGVEDYEIIVPESLLRQSQKTQQIFNIVMGAIAGLSLLVGGIGIMNIMLATVLERTREIGVRRAVGATASDIMRQFLIESVTICLIGCVAGVILGLVTSRAISFYAGWPTIVSAFSIVLSVGVSTTVGILFGLFPAAKAARINVIDALRYE